MHQQSLSEFFQVKKKVHKETTPTLPNVIRYDSPTKMDMEPTFEMEDEFPETASQSPTRRDKGRTQFYFSQDDSRMNFPSFGISALSNPFPFQKDQMGNTEISMNIENYFKRVPKRVVRDQDNSRMTGTSSCKKKYRDNDNFLGKWLQKCAMNQYSWKKLPKEIMLRVMSFLSLKDNARIASVCRYFKVCFHSIWLNHEYFSVLDLNEMGQAQVDQLFQRGNKLPQVQLFKQMLSGKKVGMFLKKNSIKTRMSAKFEKKEKLFEEFSLKPAKPNLAVLITDRDIIGVCESSRSSLIYVSLVSCSLLTETSFRALAQCTYMQHLSIKGARITDENVEEILVRCQSLTRLCLSKCDNLTDRVLELISHLALRLESLDLSGNSRMKYNDIYKLGELRWLVSLNLGFSCVTVDHFLPILKTVALKSLNVESTPKLNDGFLYAITESKISETLEKIDLGKNQMLTEQAVWILAGACPNLVEINYPLESDRIRNKLAENKVNSMTAKNKKQLDVEVV